MVSISHAPPTPDKTRTHKELAAELGVSETTIKSYRRKFPAYFVVARRGKPLRLTAESSAVAHLVQDCFKQGYSVEETRSELAAAFPHLAGRKVAARRPRSGTAHPATAPDTTPAPDLEPLLAVLNRLADSQGALERSLDERLTRLETLVKGALARSEEAGAARDRELSRQVSRALSGLGEALRGSLETALGSLETRLATRESAARPSEPGRGPKVVNVTNAYGETTRYEVGPAPGVTPPAETPRAATVASSQNAEAPGQSASQLPQEFLELPLVIKSGTDYLGIAGKSSGRFTVGDFLELARESFSTSERFKESYVQQGSGYLLTLAQQNVSGPGHRYDCLILAETTPKGNGVGLLESLAVDGVDAPPANLYVFIKRMKDM